MNRSRLAEYSEVNIAHVDVAANGYKVAEKTLTLVGLLKLRLGHCVYKVLKRVSFRRRIVKVETEKLHR